MQFTQQADDYVNNHTPFKCYRDLSIAICLLIAAVIVPVVSWQGFLKPETEQLATWIQRSGAIVVFLCVVSEYYVSRLLGILNPPGFTSVGTKKLEKKLGLPLNIIQIIVLILGAIGTLLWGYGDLLPLSS